MKQRTCAWYTMTIFALAAAGFSGCTAPPEKRGLAYSGSVRADHVQLLLDETWVDSEGTRHVDQEIYDSVYEMIDAAERFILIDMFLLNDFGYVPGPCMKPLSQELADRLVAKRTSHPGVEIIFITDPINTVYSSIESPQFNAMQEAGVQVIWTDLDSLRDSNPVYSKPWRLLVKPFGVGPGNTLKNPLGEGRISIRSLLKMINFKANHRKMIITDKSLLVTSANPHSASSAHWNAALRIEGAGMKMAWEAESAILKMSGAEAVIPQKVGLDRRASRDSDQRDGRLVDPSLPPDNLELLTESRIKEKVLNLLQEAPEGARIDLSMFYLSEKEIIKAFIRASERGCNMRVILDPSKDAFGRIKSGVPNRQSAAKLVSAGISVRWAETHGEQCHAKMLYVEQGDDEAVLLLGSGNYTRRNMNDFNCEADLAFSAPVDEANLQRARKVFDRWWNNTAGRTYTVEYAVYEDNSRWRRFSAWWKETTGMGSF